MIQWLILYSDTWLLHSLQDYSYGHENVTYENYDNVVVDDDSNGADDAFWGCMIGVLTDITHEMEFAWFKIFSGFSSEGYICVLAYDLGINGTMVLDREVNYS